MSNFNNVLYYLNLFFFAFNTASGLAALLMGNYGQAVLSLAVAGLNYYAYKTLESARS